MSHPLAISTVSAALRRRVLSAAQDSVSAASVRLGPPVAKLADDGAPLVNLHLYRVEPNAAQRNAHLPSRAGSGQRRASSQLALNLHYLLSFYGDHDQFEAERLLSAVMLALEDEPSLSAATVARAIGESDLLEDSDLDRATAQLRVSRQTMSLDDFSKLWSVFYQVPYTLSLTYEVTHVVIETPDPGVVALPVAQAGLWVAPLPLMRLDRVVTPMPVWDGVLEIAGTGLGGPGLGLVVDGATVEMGQVTQSEGQMQIQLTDASFPTGALGVGVHRLQVLAAPAPGQPDHLRARSNALAFALHPAITAAAVSAPPGGDSASGTVAVTVAPAIAPGQEVRLLLDARDPAQPAHVALPGRDPDAQGDPQTELTFAFTDQPRGDWLMRLEVDGLISPLTHDANPASPGFGQITGPVMTL